MNINDFFQQILFSVDGFSLTVGNLTVLILLLAALLFVYRLLIRKLLPPYIKKREVPPEAQKQLRTRIDWSFFILASLMLLLGLKFNHGLDNINFVLHRYTIKEVAYEFRLSNILTILLIFFVARLSVWVLTQIILLTYYKRKEINAGTRFSINQLIKYFIYSVALFMAIDTIGGVKLTLVWGGVAALLVGLGLGVKDTFNDFVSGIILLFERTVEVGDVVKIDGSVGKVTKIGLRTSLVNTRENTSVIVPNSKLIINNVANWSYRDKKARFWISLSVAYGTDVEKVRDLLLEVAGNHKKVLKSPAPFVRFTNFGDSGLEFELHFFSKEFIAIEDVQSDLRFDINRILKENNITIPFPQRDVWIRK